MQQVKIVLHGCLSPVQTKYQLTSQKEIKKLFYSNKARHLDIIALLDINWATTSMQFVYCQDFF